MFIAYLVPTEDHHVLVEHGLRFLAAGENVQAAKDNLRGKFMAAIDPDDPRETLESWWDATCQFYEMGNDTSRMPADVCFTLHFEEV